MTTDYSKTETTVEYSTTVTEHSTSQSTSSGVIDKQFVKSIPGILKLFEMVCVVYVVVVTLLFLPFLWSLHTMPCCRYRKDYHHLRFHITNESTVYISGLFL